MDERKLNVLKESLREYQYDALIVCKEYLSLEGNGEDNGHALVHLPTGGGKTGIMASLCAISKTKNILIIVPNAVLPEQTLTEIKEKFWENLDIDLKKLEVDNINIQLLNNKNQFKNLDNSDGKVYIATIQFLVNNISKDGIINKEIVGSINDNIDYILFDEGHREPAKKWSKVIRKFKSKLILFTATPYRNDNSVFQISDDYIYSKEMEYFIKKGYISDAIFESLEPSIKKSNNLLSATSNIHNKKLLEIVEKEINNGKIIIRCYGVNKIEEIVNYLNLNCSKFRAAGFHYKIKKGENYFKEGNSIFENLNKYDIFVHSETLIEGLNIQAIKTIILLDTFSNFKTATQQIGRALRNEEIPARIYVPAQVKKDHELQWQNLLKYKYIGNNDQVEYIYESKLLKEKYIGEHTKESIENNILIPMKANIYFTKKDIWDDLVEEINLTIKENKLCNIIYDNNSDNDNKKHIIYYEDFTYSKYLNHIAYENRNLQISILTKVKSKVNKGVYYFYYNSKNNSAFKTDSLYDSLNSELVDVSKLLSDSFEIKKASYEKTIPVKEGGIRANEVSGRRIEATGASVEQKLSFSRNMLAKDNHKNITRYINTITSRVSDTRFGTIDEYLEWNKDIVSKIESESKPHNFLDRFAKICIKSPKYGPTYIYGEFNNIYTVLGEETELGEFDARISSNKNNDENGEDENKRNEHNEFEIKIGDLKEKFEVEFNEKIKRYKVKKSKNTKSSYNRIELENEDETIALLDAINKSNFVIYFLKDRLIYTEGRYYKPNINTSFDNPEDWTMWENIKNIEGLDECKSEKGKKEDAKEIRNWPINSVFRVLIDYIKNNRKEIEYLVCDDMGTEISDFIAIDPSSKKIIYIHCKYSDSKLSASTFQDICGQANKNMRYIINTSQENNKYFKDRKKKWSINWPEHGKNLNQVGGKIDRCIKGGNAEEIHAKLEVMISEPDTKYEVWLVHSGLSHKDLENQIIKKEEDQKEEISQIVWLLQSTQDYFSQVNTKVKIFCKP